MKLRIPMVLAAISLTFALASTARALDYNNSFNAAKAALSKAEAVMKQMQAGGNKQLVHTLIDDAKMLLHSGIHNHEKPQGAFDHARAIAKARSAKGYAEAAEILAKAMK